MQPIPSVFASQHRWLACPAAAGCTAVRAESLFMGEVL